MLHPFCSQLLLAVTGADKVAVPCADWHIVPSIAGEYMWLEADDGSGSSAARHFGRKYHQLCAQRDRCAEEVDILKCEMLRLCNGLEERTALLQAAVEELTSSVDGGGTTDSWLAQLNAGRAAALRAELLRLQIIQTNAIKLRVKHSL